MHHELRPDETARTTAHRPAGRRLPANDASAWADDLDLPMPYRPAWAPPDLLLGLNYRHHRWNAALAYQPACFPRGNSTSSPTPWWMDDMDALGYFESWGWSANDAVARIQYALPIGDLAIQPGLLAITTWTRTPGWTAPARAWPWRAPTA